MNLLQTLLKSAQTPPAISGNMSAAGCNCLVRSRAPVQRSVAMEAVKIRLNPHLLFFAENVHDCDGHGRWGKRAAVAILNLNPYKSGMWLRKIAEEFHFPAVSTVPKSKRRVQCPGQLDEDLANIESDQLRIFCATSRNPLLVRLAGSWW